MTTFSIGVGSDSVYTPEQLLNKIEGYYAASSSAYGDLSGLATETKNLDLNWDALAANYSDIADRYSEYVSGQIPQLTQMADQYLNPDNVANYGDLYAADAAEQANVLREQALASDPRLRTNQGALRELMQNAGAATTSARQKGILDQAQQQQELVTKRAGLATDTANLLKGEADLRGNVASTITGKQNAYSAAANMTQAAAAGYRGLGQDALSLLDNASNATQRYGTGIGNTSSVSRELSLANAASRASGAANAPTGMSSTPLSKAYNGASIYTDPTYKSSLLSAQAQIASERASRNTLIPRV